MSDLVPSTSAAVMGSGENVVELPSKIMVTRGPGSFELSWRWRDQTSKGAFFAPLLSGLGGLGGLLNLTSHWPAAGALAVLAVAGVAVGTGAAYAKNVMRVRVSQGALTFSSGPVGGRTHEILAADVEDIVAVPPRRRRSRDGAWWAVSVLFRAGPGEKPPRPRMIVGYMLKQAQAEQIATLLRTELAK